MKNKAILIGGVLAILVAGAYMFVKKKKKTNLGTGASFGEKVISPSGTSLSSISNAEELAQAEKIKQDIKNLATSIKTKKDEIARLRTRISPILSANKFGGLGLAISSRNLAYQKQISEIQKDIDAELSQMNQLGYTELNGSAVKIG
jgi:uncharacterized protein YycO